ncbi:hypothetical protein [Tessaracoccus flavescens]|uniref:PIN domain-containing protein n=1 Tax=Tessaracoccus flavescens TaxID=399497 RepID=A0A1Q2CWI1_9ACTN|nr:hypothetical protein [Tessaracoccus flavescens]AQP50449.1 hypothetical protein BW733_05990 [Tessaracoccus flavescens]
MPDNRVILIDTSVFLNLLRVPGRCGDADACRKEFERLAKADVKFVLPITTIVETGNFIQQCTGDRRAAAQRFENALIAATEDAPPWIIRDVKWDPEFVLALTAGDSTGTSMVDHFTSKSLGAGDIAILVERDQFLRQTPYQDVQVWSLDAGLQAHGRPAHAGGSG